MQATESLAVPVKPFFPSRTAQRLATFTFEEGLPLLDNFCQSSNRTRMIRRGKIKCACCGAEGTHFNLERMGRPAKFTLSLYATTNHDGIVSESMITLDHILPASLGGSDHPSNWQAMCLKCNQRKGNKLSLKEILAIASSESAASMYKSYIDTADKTNIIPKILKCVRKEFRELNLSKKHV